MAIGCPHELPLREGTAAIPSEDQRMSIVEAKGLSKDYVRGRNQIRVLDSVDLDLRKGSSSP